MDKKVSLQHMIGFKKWNIDMVPSNMQKVHVGIALNKSRGLSLLIIL